MNTKRLVSLLVALILMVSLFSMASADSGKVKLKLGIWPEDTMTAEVELHQGYAKTFSETHPNVEVVPAYYKYATDTFVSLAESGNLPTIFESWYTEPQKLIKGGFVKDITDLLAARGWLDAINPSIRALMSDANGRVYGIPRDGYALGLMCNVELFEEAGLANADGTIQYPKTWEELAAASKTIKDKTGSAGLCLLAKDAAGGWHFSNIAWAFGADLCTVDENGKFKANLATPEAIAAMEYVKSLKWTYDVLTADPTNEDWGTGFSELGTGGAAMYIGANDAVMQPTYTNGLAVDKLALVPMPAGPGGQFSLSGGTPYMFAANATDEEVNAALDYLEVMGKAPVASDAAIKGMKADAEYRVANGIPVIPRFPCWTKQELLDAEDAIIKEYSNVNTALFDEYFAVTKKEGNLHMEEEGSTQDMYAELTKVLQAVVTDQNADVAALMKTASDNYQTILDNGFNK
jgi:ABC-type glycerol-3-phosphate transport system substrate-binding protein